MKVIGLTGGIASGKSTISRLIKEKGAVIIDADVIARQIVEPGKPAWLELVSHFGKEILQEDGSINRKKLANIVFSDRKQLEVLNKITHPRIGEEIKRQLESCRQKNEDVVVIDAALLLEFGLDIVVDEIWLVAVDEKNQLKRLLEREKNMNFDEAVERIKAQMPLEEKLKFADRVIDNNGSLEDTKRQLDKIWEEMKHTC